VLLVAQARSWQALQTCSAELWGVGHWSTQTNSSLRDIVHIDLISQQHKRLLGFNIRIRILLQRQ